MRRKKAKIIAVSLCLTFLLSSCEKEAGEQKIVVGAKDFTENKILGELYALALEDAGFEVERKFGISDLDIHEELREGRIDVYPEYTETALLWRLGEEPSTDFDKVYQTIKNGYERLYHLEVLEYSNVNYQKGIGIRTETAVEYGIWTISQLQANADQFVFGMTPEWIEQQEELASLEQVYGNFEFQEIKNIESDRRYEELQDQEVDCIPVYAADTQLKEEEFTLLEDDQNFWIPNFIFPVMQSDLAKEEQDAVDAINEISSMLKQEEIIILNEGADGDEEGYKNVAQTYYYYKKK